MLSKLLDAIVGYFKGKPYWDKLQPVFIVSGIYFFALTIAYQFLDWRYQISPGLSDFLRSYIFQEITLIFIAFVVVLLLFGIQDRVSKEGMESKFGELFQRSFRRVLRRLAVVGIVLAFTVPVFLHMSPSRVDHIRVVFFEKPDFDKYAFLYVIYELNKFQRSWRFIVDEDIFDERNLRSTDKKRCSGERDEVLCFAQAIAGGKPLIAITTKTFDQDSFWQNQGMTSVVSTFMWNQLYKPPSIYEYLAYSIVVQSIKIHLNARGKNINYGEFDFLQFMARRNAMRAEVLAAHLSREGEVMLLNSFGAEYMSTCSKLLSLDWLRSEKVMRNLEKNFKVTF